MTAPDLGFHHRLVRKDSSHTLLLLHGTGGDEQDMIPLAEQLAPGVSLLSARGKVLENGMPRFFKRLRPGVFDEEDLVLRTHELADFVGRAVEAYDLDPDRIIAVGYSNGANIAAAMLLLRPEVLHAAALLHAMVPLRPQRLPQLPATAVLMTAGRQDPIAPPQQSEELATMLRAAAADLTVHWGDNGHRIDKTELLEVQRWLDLELRRS